MEDKWARDFLVEHARQKSNAIEFVDYSVQDPFDSAWKAQCSARIARTKGTIVLIGPTTAQSAAVLWEILETKSQGNNVFGIQINRDRTYPVPSGVPSVIRWDFDAIVAQLSKWV